MTFTKGVDILIKAFHKASRHYHDLKLIVVGEGEELDQYRSLIKNLGIESKVIVTGLVPEDALLYYTIRLQISLLILLLQALRRLALLYLKQ
jgi:glycosyltransferase involved in cell wall biosynthesis